uniref:LOW QUALITY PROTEIN: zinc finger protein CONSTANS-LIKE 16-like n=1 Tax=Elaeis guineensis var. tenera TaxID=51953 RepID=A0A6I9RP36_ELAGV|nr:LOW QUALITY PROTEIN: zinc finger protein CONSTANS-LIKE 16-like [Elaeis guineensis]
MSHHSDELRSPGALGGKTAHACDGCLRRRARWYCAADDAFLCMACDASVHSANTLALRHHRLRLQTSSSSPPLSSNFDDALPPWLHGFKRRARTPRVKPSPAGPPKLEPLVPDLEADEKLYAEEEHLLHRVPIFDPVLAEFFSPPAINDADTLTDEAKPVAQLPEHAHVPAPAAAAGSLAGFQPSDLDLDEFAANVETLLGRGLDDGTFCIDALGLIDSAKDDDKGRVKVELDIDAGGGSDVVACNTDMEIDLSTETLDIDFGRRLRGEEHEEQKVAEEAAMASGGGGGVERAAAGRGMMLRLDYEAVIAAWSCNGCSPWTDGERPQFNLDDFMMMMWSGGSVREGGGWKVAPVYGEVGMAAGNGGREARVTRYREKRRTRLFSKKIRYEVRKLNAEKRPRMKGRFVKRAAFPAARPAAAPFTFDNDSGEQNACKGVAMQYS